MRLHLRQGRLRRAFDYGKVGKGCVKSLKTVKFVCGLSENTMNIQIFGTKKSADTRKAERFFKERGIKFQSVDLKEKGLSKGELQCVIQAVGNLEAVIDPDCRDKDLLALIKYIAEEDKLQKVLENQCVLRQPIVRNGKQATAGYQPDVWKSWQ